MKTIKRVTVPSFQDSPKNVNLYVQKLLAACRVKEDYPTLCDDVAAQCLFAEQMCHAPPVLHRLAQRLPSVPASTITPDEIAYDDSKNSKKKNELRRRYV